MIFNLKRESILKKYLHDINKKKYINNIKKLHIISQNNDFFIYSIKKKDVRKVISSTQKEIIKEIGKLNMTTGLNELHKLRKKLKKVRYELDMYENCFKNKINFIYDFNKIKELQDLFGTIQDNHVFFNFIISAKKEFTKMEFLELKNHFQLKIYIARKELLNALL